jgi:small subunit ribosomal protein S9
MVTPKTDSITGEALGTGRRKTSIARVRVRPGSGTFLVNGRPMEEYFTTEGTRRTILQALDEVEQRGSLDVRVRVSGGGPTGQAGAIRMGLARALIAVNEAFFGPMRDKGYLTRDPRMKERKKYGLRGARRGVQFSKR